MWDNIVLQLVGVEESCFTLSCRFRNSKDNFTWVFTRVYGSIKREQREYLWGELGAVKGLWGGSLVHRRGLQCGKIPRGKE